VLCRIDLVFSCSDVSTDAKVPFSRYLARSFCVGCCSYLVLPCHGFGGKGFQNNIYVFYTFPAHPTKSVECTYMIIHVCVDTISETDVDGLLQLLEDSLQMHRLRYVIDGRVDDSRDEQVQGMLGKSYLLHRLIEHCILTSVLL